MSSFGTGVRSLARYRVAVPTISANRTIFAPTTNLYVSQGLCLASDCISTASSVMPALNLLEDEIVRPERSPFEAILDQPHIRVRDWNTVERKLRAIASGGKEQLLLISDFDMTLSRSVDDQGERCWTTHGVFDNCADEVDATLGEKLSGLKAKYHPIEFCPKLTMEEKIPHMEAWWNGSHNYIVAAGFEKWRIEKFVKRSKIVLRSGTEQMMTRLETAAVPLVVFSAGLGDIIDIYFMQKFGRRLKNMHLISNMMKFDEQERVIGFSEPLIHTFCKNSSVIRKDEQFFHEVSQRTNVILLGDSMGDIHMDVGVEKDGPTLKIGFLNSNVENLLEQYMDAYDIVIIQDQTMTVPAQLIERVLKQ